MATVPPHLLLAPHLVVPHLLVAIAPTPHVHSCVHSSGRVASPRTWNLLHVISVRKVRDLLPSHACYGNATYRIKLTGLDIEVLCACVCVHVCVCMCVCVCVCALSLLRLRQATELVHRHSVSIFGYGPFDWSVFTGTQPPKTNILHKTNKQTNKQPTTLT